VEGAIEVGAVLLFNNCAPAHLAARLHAAACPMVAMADRPGRRVAAIRDNLEWEIADLEERGWPVKRCKCLAQGGG